MNEFLKLSRINEKFDPLILLIPISSIGFALIGYLSFIILLKLSFSDFEFEPLVELNLVIIVLLTSFISGSFFTIILDRSLARDRMNRDFYKINCIICRLPLKHQIVFCKQCDIAYHKWHQISENQPQDLRCVNCNSSINEKSLENSDISEKGNKLVIMDGTNIACESKPPSLKKVRLAKEFLISEGFETICFVSSALKYRISEKEELIKEISEGNILQAPAGSYDDRYIVETAKKLNGYILSNDKYSDLVDYNKLVKNRRLTYTFISDENIIVDLSNYNA